MTKKQLIMEKAIELFATQGFETTSVQQITDYCGISKGAFYLSFKSKDELISTLIDQFMMQIIADIDCVVNQTKDKEQILYKFYYSTYHYFQKHSDFTRVFIKEQMQSVNEELITKVRHYNGQIENIILSMIEKIYGEEVELIKYDLMYCIKSFMNTYSELLLYYNLPLDLHIMCQSLVEKTNIIAEHSGISFISSEMELVKQPINEVVKKEDLLNMLQQKMNEIEGPIEKESLSLLKQHIEEPSLNKAIVIGLIGNIGKNPHGKWITYLLQHYFKL